MHAIRSSPPARSPISPISTLRPQPGATASPPIGAGRKKNPASLYEAFTALEARRLVERFEWHYTPKHGSWLNMAESELAILSNQCLDRRIPDRRNLERQVAAWLLNRNTYNVQASQRYLKFQ